MEMKHLRNREGNRVAAVGQSLRRTVVLVTLLTLVLTPMASAERTQLYSVRINR